MTRHLIKRRVAVAAVVIVVSRATVNFRNLASPRAESQFLCRRFSLSLSLSLFFLHSSLSFRPPPPPLVASRHRGLLFFLLRRHRYDSFCRPQSAATPCSCRSYFCPRPSFARPLIPTALSPPLPPHPAAPLPQPFSGPVGKARETFIFACRKSKAEREVLPADRYCEADVFCDSSVIRERVRERR